MSTYFVKFHVVPTECNAQHSLVESAFAYCFVVEDISSAAHNKARFYVTKEEWEIAETDVYAAEVDQADFDGQDVGLECYLKAQQTGIAIAYVGWARNGETEVGPIPLERANAFDLNAYIGEQKKLAQKGRCLHVDSGDRCGTMISAHSIQKNGQLSVIADKGHVYTVSSNIGTFKKNDGRPALERRGIGKVSTFLGFCNTHDNQLFAPIDTEPLQPNDEQVFLYAYRSICRELFVKENALNLIDSQRSKLPAASALRKFFDDWRTGTSFGLESLRWHKASFDGSLNGKCYTDVEYVLFVSKQKQVLAFSGLFFPVFDFLGRPLQNLADRNSRPNLLTICSAPFAEGWGFLFAWHKTSAPICAEFMRSLATFIHKDESRISDALFRLVASNCENLAVSPEWWEALPAEQQDSITERLFYGANFFTPVDSGYLVRGLEGICQWHFDDVRASSARPSSV